MVRQQSILCVQPRPCKRGNKENGSDRVTQLYSSQSAPVSLFVPLPWQCSSHGFGDGAPKGGAFDDSLFIFKHFGVHVICNLQTSTCNGSHWRNQNNATATGQDPRKQNWSYCLCKWHNAHSLSFLSITQALAKRQWKMADSTFHQDWWVGTGKKLGENVWQAFTPF